eukprot:10967346-Alexandrium_andersonii.AAC.1
MSCGENFQGDTLDCGDCMEEKLKAMGNNGGPSPRQLEGDSEAQHDAGMGADEAPVSYTHLRAHETSAHL